MLKDFNETFQDELLDDKFAAGLLKVSLEEEGFETFLVSLREIVKARGGMTALAKATGLGRESLYKALSQEGDPKFSTVYGVLKALGFEVAFTPGARRAAGGTKPRARKLPSSVPATVS